MTYTYDDIVTAKDILTGKVKKEDIIGASGWFLRCIPEDMSLNTIARVGSFGILGEVDLSYNSVFLLTTTGVRWTYFLPEKKKSAPEFKVGDKVKIVKEWIGWEPDCNPTVGKTGIIRTIGSTSCGVYFPEDGDWWWMYSPDALELIEETAEEKKSYEERQDEWIKANDIKAGDKVRVLRKAKSYEDGWDNAWLDSMDKGIGETLTVDGSCGDCGIALYGSMFGHWYKFPYFVLEKVEDKPKYTEADIISDPRDPRLEGAIGKVCYVAHHLYGDGVVANANNDDKSHKGILVSLGYDPANPFEVHTEMGLHWKKIIIARISPALTKKLEDKPEYVPFDLDNPEVRRELMGKTIINNYVLDGDGEFREVMIVGFMNKSDEDRDCWSNDDTEGTIALTVEGYFHADELLKECTFLDGTPCGKLKED